MTLIKYILNVSACVSQVGNTILFLGSPDETISGRCYREYVLKNNPFYSHPYYLINSIFFWQEDHCKSSHLRDVEFAIYISSLYED